MYTHSVFHCPGNIKTNPNNPTRRLKSTKHKTDCNVYHNRLVSRLFMCRTVITKRAYRWLTLRNLENVTEPSKNISRLVSIELDS